MVASLAALKTLFITLTCVMSVALCYGVVMDGFYSCIDPRARWMQVVLTDFLIDMSLFVAWVFYKDSRWTRRIIYIFIVFWSGSVGICGYFVILLFNLSPEEASKDPIYFVLARCQKRDDIRYKRTSFVVTARVIVVALSCFMVGALIYAIVGDGSLFHMEVLTPCMVTTLTDISIHVVVFSVWITYKESSWINATFWTLLLVCFGSIGLCAYILRELLCLSPEQPVYLILFDKNRRDMQSSDPLLMGHTNV